MANHNNHDPQLLDPNMQINAVRGEWQWYSPLASPFQVLGFPWLHDEGVYRRLPLNPIHSLPPAVDKLANHTAGGQIRFRTDAERIAIRVKLAGPATMDHMAATGQCGFDAYIGEPGSERYAGTTRFKPQETLYESLLFEAAGTAGLYTVTINFPLYQGVLEAAIGLPPGTELKSAAPVSAHGRIVFYGTSITQGGCASRPGMAYVQQLGRSLRREVINLGFSGNGKGEPGLAQVIREIEDVSCLVLDYEANCTTERYLETLEPFIRLYRESRPEVRVAVVSRIPYAKENFERMRKQERLFRRKFASELVNRMREEGDPHIFFCDGSHLLGRRFDECTVDGIHPNDLGFTRMAEGLHRKLKVILES